MPTGPLMLVEDDEDLRTDLGELLTGEGYDVKPAANGAEALRDLGSGELPRLILLDLMMPVMDGWQFRRKQLEDPRLAGIPVIVLSGAADLAHHAAALKAAAHLAKPVDLDRLLALIARY